MEVVRKINIHFVAKTIGQMCLIEVPMMLLCLLVACFYGNDLLPFSLGALVYLLVGLGLYAYGTGRSVIVVGRREGMLAVASTWLILSLIATIPLLLSPGGTYEFLPALFEAISGFTTTGATIYSDVESLEESVLFWRALMQWQGGIGIVVFTVALIPMLTGSNGVSHIFNAETTGITHDRFLPKISDVAQRLAAVYISITALTILLLALGPMGLFDAVCHAFCSVSTGGYSTKTSGVGFYASTYSEYILVFAMYLGSLNITLIYFSLMGKPMKLVLDEEFRWFTVFIGGSTAVTCFWLSSNGLYLHSEEIFRKALFHCMSLGSSTGFLTADITTWKPFFWMIALVLMFVNGCTGSTTGGMKMARFIVLVKNLRNEFKKQVRPHMVVPVYFNGRQISVSVVHQILAFCVLYVVLIFIGAMLISLDGNNFETSLSLSVGCMSNSSSGIGKCINSVSDTSNFTKSILIFLMLAGRLEVFTFIGILTPYFWSK